MHQLTMEATTSTKKELEKHRHEKTISDGRHPEQGEVKVFIVDDHPLVREWLGQLLRRDRHTSVCGEAEDVQDAIQKIEETAPDIVITDLALKQTHGMELIHYLQQNHPALPILVLSMHDESLYAERVLRAGARGYVTKQEATKDIIQAVQTVLSGEIYVSKAMSIRMVNKVVHGRLEAQKTSYERLTNRELEVFQYIGRGVGTRRIAEELGLSIKTVESFRARIKEKLKLDDGTQLLTHAIQWVHSLQDH
jgi:DNA-binding NarL/FixJ family response regulator